MDVIIIIVNWLKVMSASFSFVIFSSMLVVFQNRRDVISVLVHDVFCVMKVYACIKVTCLLMHSTSTLTLTMMHVTRHDDNVGL